jgi:tetratricopeptide (TPR) repeat protein
MVRNREYVERAVKRLTSALMFCAATGVAEPQLERPIAIVTANAATNLMSGNGGPSRIAPGRIIFSGEKIKVSNEVTIAYCPGKGPGTLLQLHPNVEFELTRQGITPSSAGFLGLIPFCLLPEIDRNSPARNIADLDDSPDQAGSIRDRIASVAPELLDQYQKVAKEGDQELVGSVTTAALLQEAGLRRDARSIYRKIRDQTEDAVWTWEVITRINESLLVDHSADKTPRVRPAGTPGLVGDIPDFTKGKTFALLFGISKYPPGKGPDLKYADADALTMLKYLSSARGGGVVPIGSDGKIELTPNVKLLLNEDATRDNFQAALTELIAMSTAGVEDGANRNTLIVFVAGHGTYSCDKASLEVPATTATANTRSIASINNCPGGQKAFIVMRDGEREAPNIAGYGLEELRYLVSSQASRIGRVLLFIDVCHGGNATWGTDSRPLQNTSVVQALEANDRMLGILTGSQVTNEHKRTEEYTYESDELAHGVFTYYLLRGLNGRVAPIDGKVPIGLLYDYLDSSIKRYTKLTSPGKYTTSPNLPVVDRPEASPMDLDLNPDPNPDNAKLIPRGAADDFGLSGILKSGRLLTPEARHVLDQISTTYGPQSPEFQEARGRYQAALETRGQDVILHYLAGDQDPVPPSDFDTCATFFGAALSLAPDVAFDKSRMLFCQGRRLIFDRRYEEANQLLERSIYIDPRRSYAYNALGISYLEQTSLDHTNKAVQSPQVPETLTRAIDAFSEAIRFEPKWAYPRHNLALALSEAGRYSEAVNSYRLAMTIGPQYSYLPYNLALLYQSIKDYGEAEASYKLAIMVAEKRCGLRNIGKKETCPERNPPRTGLASVYAQEGKRRSAEKMYDMALEDAGKDPLTVHDLASLYASWKGHDVQAETNWTVNLGLHPDHIPSLSGYALFLKQRCRFEDAVPYLKRLVKLAPEYEPAWLDLSASLVRTRQPREASEALGNVKSHSAMYWAASAEIAESMQNKAQADADWNQALSNAADDSVRKSIMRRKNHWSSCPAF